jgi:hypothetical protein
MNLRKLGDTMRHHVPLMEATFHLYIRKSGWYKICDRFGTKHFRGSAENPDGADEDKKKNGARRCGSNGDPDSDSDPRGRISKGAGEGVAQDYVGSGRSAGQ